MPAIRGMNIGASNINVVDLNGQTLRVRKNLIDGLTPEEVESKFNLWIAANLTSETWTVYLHCFSISPLVVLARVQNKTEPEPPANWWM